MKILLAQCNFTLGDFASNTRLILDVIKKAGQTNDLLVFSELCLSGYYPKDLIEQAGFIEEQDRHLALIKQASQQLRASVVLGVIERNKEPGKAWFNALHVYQRGKHVFTYHKKLLPTYNIFDETRHFQAGTGLGLWQLGQTKIGFLICEDAWCQADIDYAGLDPIDELQLAGAELLICINGSPSDQYQLQQRHQIAASICTNYHLPFIYVNQVGGHDDLVFDGNSMAFNHKGQLLAQLPAFQEATQTVTLAVLQGKGSTHAVLPLNCPDKIALFHRQILCGLADYLKKCGFQDVVIGCSGGIDSALTLALATEALGSSHVCAITMPTRHSSAGSVADSETLCQNLGVKLYNIPIEQEYQLSITRFNASFAVAPSRLTCENMQARIRGRVLMEYSNHFGHLLLSTGNKSELSVGYATLYGDMNGGLNVLGDLYKTEVYQLADFMNSQAPHPLIPQAIIDKAPSAELSDDQKDSDSLPEYPVLDAILSLYLEQDCMSQVDIDSQKKQLSSCPKETLSAILTLIDRAEFKRHQSPPIIRLHRRSFGAGRQLPIAQRFTHKDALVQALLT